MSAIVAMTAMHIVRADSVGQEEDSFVRKHFGDEPPAPVTLRLGGEPAKAAARILGYPYPKTSTRYWRQGNRTAWMMHGRGKTYVITTGFIVEEGKITATEVLIYREHRGHAVQAERFTRQFAGTSLKRGEKLDRRIQAVTGATISSHAMINMARLALVWDAIVGRD